MSEWSDDPSGDPDDFGDDEAFGAPLPPEDRLWRHPSELFAEEPDAGTTTSRRRSTLAVVAVVAAAAGAVTASLALTLGGVVTVGGSAGSTGSPAAQQGSSDPWPPSAETVANAVHGGIVTVAAPDRPGAGAQGVVVEAGTVITSAGALGGAVEVMLHQAGDRQRGTVVGTDPATGLAVIDVGAGVDGGAVADDILRSRPGEKPVTVGEVLIEVGRGDGGLRWRPTAVTATGEVATEGSATRWGLIATDRATAASRAGAALVDGEARLVGVCLSTDDTENGHAVPMDQVQSIVREVRRHGRVRRAWLGVSGTDALVTPASTTTPTDTSPTRPTIRSTPATGPPDPGGDMPASRGARIGAVEEDSPAGGSLAPGDVIIGVDDQPVDAWADLEGIIRTSRPGVRISLTVRRGDDVRSELIELSVPPDGRNGA